MMWWSRNQINSKIIDKDRGEEVTEESNQRCAYLDDYGDDDSTYCGW